MKKNKCDKCGIEFKSKSSLFDLVNPNTGCYETFCKFHCLEFLEMQGFRFEGKDGAYVKSKDMTIKELKYHVFHLNTFLKQKLINNLIK